MYNQLLMLQTLVSLCMFPSYADLDELFQLGAVLQLGVAVEQQCGVVWIGQRLSVQSLQVGCQVVNPLSIQELPDHIRGLQLPNSAERGACVLILSAHPRD